MSRGLQQGDTMPPVRVPVSRAALVRYAGASGDFNPIHYSDAAAAGAGLPGVIAHGMYTMAVAAQAVADWCAPHGQLVDFEVRFSRPVVVPPVGEAWVDITGTVTSCDHGVAKVTLDVTCDGARVLGKAVAQVATGQGIDH